MSFGEKLSVAMKLRRQAWNMKMAWIAREHPEWTEEQVREKTKKFFLHGDR